MDINKYERTVREPHEDYKANLQAAMWLWHKHFNAFGDIIKFQIEEDDRLVPPELAFTLKFINLDSKSDFSFVWLHQDCEMFKTEIQAAYKAVMRKLGMYPMRSWNRFVNQSAEFIAKYHKQLAFQPYTAGELMPVIKDSIQQTLEDDYLVSSVLTHRTKVQLDFEAYAREICMLDLEKLAGTHLYESINFKCPGCNERYGYIFKENDLKYSWFCYKVKCLKQDIKL